ncbi:NAD(+)/NADH kinase [Candidatus Gracilibacteria bacterium]|nr:NAD(+)/NADH kinase [Candidatus Gracilibacteria bacterium]
MRTSSPLTDIQNIGIIVKQSLNNFEPLIKQLSDFLLAKQKNILLDKYAANFLGKPDLGMARNKLLNEAQLVIVIGGDGTLLSVARELTDRPVHVLCINAGTLGFLTEVMPERTLSALEEILQGNYTLDERLLLRVTTYRDGKKESTNLALNDAVISQGAMARLVELLVEVNQRQVNRYQADGLIISTPTGSTGHSLSAGGPIVHPKLDAFVLSPICPLSLANRPIVLPADRQLTITVATKRVPAESISLTIDGQVCIPLDYDMQIKIRKSSRKLYLVRLTSGGENYYKKIRSKLSWG